MQLETLPSPQEILKIYIASAGITTLAIDRINRQFYGVTTPTEYVFKEVDLYTTLGQPQVLEQLQAQTRAQIVMRTFEAANQALAVAIAKLGDQEPFEASKTATNLIQQLESLTANKKSEVNVNTMIWQDLIPHEARAAIDFLKQQASQNIIEHDS